MAKNLSLLAFLIGLVVFALAVTGSTGSLLFPALAVAAVAALVAIVFGHRGFAAARRAGSGSGVALATLALSYLLLISAVLFGVVVLLALKNFQ
jgi:hypothetical protein